MKTINTKTINTTKTKTKFITVISAVSLLALSACNDDMSDVVDTMTETMTYTYSVTIKNLTQGQPMSPFVLLAHDEGMLFNIGDSASESLEYMAEGGQTSMLLAQDWVSESTTASAMLMPGQSVTLMLEDLDMMPNYLSVASMLVATNDGFTAVNAFDTSMLMDGESYTLMGNVYDSGTELNSEMAGTMPGIDGGEGFNSERVDTNVVTMHPGVISMYDGLTQSVLTSHHRFDNPAIKVVISKK